MISEGCKERNDESWQDSLESSSRRHVSYCRVTVGGSPAQGVGKCLMLGRAVYLGFVRLIKV